MKKISLKSKLLIAFMGTGLIPVFGLGAYFYWQTSKALETQALERLESIRELKSTAIKNYFKLIENQILVMANSENLKTVFTDFSQGYNGFLSENKFNDIDLIAQKQKLKSYYVQEYAKEYEAQNKRKIETNSLLNLNETQSSLQASYIAFNPNPLGSKHLLEDLKLKSRYNNAHKSYHPNIREFLERFELYDIFLIDAKTGDIIYTVFKELDFATSLKNGPYRNSGLAKAYNRAMNLTSENEIVMEDYASYTPSYDGPASFIATPIWINGEKVGVLAFQISFDKINSIMAEKNGHDKTLETFIVGSDFLMRSDSLMDKVNRNVRASFRNPEVGSVKTEIIKSSLNGFSSKNLALNYLGYPAAIVAAPLEVHGQKWVITSQISQNEAFSAIKEMRWVFILFVIASAFIVATFAIWFARKLANSLLKVTEGLRLEADTVGISSQKVAEVSSKLSEATTEQAASLQETVASIDEISAMIARNADSAASSSRTSEYSTLAAQKGKDKVDLMIDSINAISSGNREIIEQMQLSNKEISEIIKVIQEISQKTQVINDIVFQTKLLSFNASVEAARAGEHGKGFAVVAEEVGNLASMSGKAATEITEMLTKSVKRVTDIVDGTKGLMDNLIRQSKEKVELGTNTARDCALALDEILTNVSSVNEMVREISNASQEQSTGVREVNKAMSELDQVTQANSAAAQESSHAARDLKSQADRLNDLVAELRSMVKGSEKKDQHNIPDTTSRNSPSNVINLSKERIIPKMNVVNPRQSKSAVGIEYEIPSSDDHRFEEA